MPTITFTIDNTIPGVGPKKLTFRPRQAFVTPGGDIVPDLPRPILDKPYARGVEHSENLPEGPWSVEGIENGKLVPFDVGPTGGALKDLIALGIPGDAPATTLSQAVTSWMNANVNTEVTEPLVEGILADPDSAARTVLDSTYGRVWKPGTDYAEGDLVLLPAPINGPGTRNSSGTSRGSFDATEQGLWTATGGGVKTVNGTAPDGSGNVTVVTGSKIFTDTDGTPYFDPAQSGPGVSIAADTDGVPYLIGT